MTDVHAVSSTPALPAADGAVGVGYVDWGVVLAGAVAAAALFFLFTTFGSAVGLSVASPWTGASATTLGLMAAIWFLVVQVLSFAAGGYLAGRMRRRLTDATPDEVEFRDGSHGFLVWCVGFLASALLVVATTTGIVQSGIQGGAAAISASAPRGASADPLGFAVDTMFRTTQAPAQGQAPDARAEATRAIAAAAARGELTTADRTYLGQVVARRTGLEPQEAEKRVTEAFNRVRDATEQTRRAGAITGFLIAASLLVSAAAAWFAAQSGGQHRDAGTVNRWLRRRFDAP